MQWTTVRLVISETMGAVTTGNKTPQGEEAYLRFARGDETRDSALRKTARSNSGLNAETRMGRY
jgi:hypothetical protein